MDVTIYTSYGWGPCTLTKSWLKKHNIQYKEESVEDSAIVSKLLALGFRSTPVIIAGAETIVGYNPKRLSEVFIK